MIKSMQSLSLQPSVSVKIKERRAPEVGPDRVTLGERPPVSYSKTLLAGLFGSTPAVGAAMNFSGALSSLFDHRPIWVGSTLALGVVANLAGTACLVGWAITGNSALAQVGVAGLATSGIASGIGSVEMSRPAGPRTFF